MLSDVHASFIKVFFQKYVLLMDSHRCTVEIINLLNFDKNFGFQLYHSIGLHLLVFNLVVNLIQLESIFIVIKRSLFQ